MMFGQKYVDIFEPQQTLLLYDLSVDIRGSQCFDLFDEVIADPFNGLDGVSFRP